MTEFQKLAIEHPCLVAVETVHPRFRHSGEIKGAEVLSLILTMNAGYE